MVKGVYHPCHVGMWHLKEVPLCLVCKFYRIELLFWLKFGSAGNGKNSIAKKFFSINKIIFTFESVNCVCVCVFVFTLQRTFH